MNVITNPFFSQCLHRSFPSLLVSSSQHHTHSKFRKTLHQCKPYALVPSRHHRHRLLRPPPSFIHHSLSTDTFNIHNTCNTPHQHFNVFLSNQNHKFISIITPSIQTLFKHDIILNPILIICLHIRIEMLKGKSL